MPGYGDADTTKAHQIADSFKSPRYLYIERLENYIFGTQYKGRPNWWTALDTPIVEREPCIVDPLARTARDSYVDLVLGEHRFPTIDIEGVEADERRLAFRRARFEPAVREAFASGIGTSSAAVIVGIRDGRPFIDTVPVKWCRPKFGSDQRTVESLEIQYAYVVEERDPADGKWKAHARLFRRVIDATLDTTFKPVELLDATTEPKWTVDKDRTITHGLGYCPVVWWAAMRGACVEGRYDGHAIHEHSLDAITSHDLALSQRQNAAFFAGSPQWVEIGVQPGYIPTEGGRSTRIPATPSGGPLAQGQRTPSSYVSSGGNTKARKKGPGQVWQYPDSMTKVELHQLSAGALDALDKNARDLRLKICDALAYVPQDPDTIPLKGVSGKALEALKEKQLSRCDYLRDDAGDGLIVPLVIMMCRVCGLGKTKDEKGDKTKDEKGDTEIDEEAVTLTWPPYYMPNAEDRAKELSAEVAAMVQGAGFVSVPEFKTAAQKRMTRLVLDGSSDEDLEAIENAIDADAELAQAQAAASTPPPQDPNAPPQGGQLPGGSNATEPGETPGASRAPGQTPPAAPSPQSPQGKTGKVLPIMPKARAAARAKAPVDPGGVGSATVAKGIAEKSTTGPAGLSAAQAHTAKVAPDAHMRASGAEPPAFNRGVAETVFALLKDDYPDKAIAWIRDPKIVSSIEGPRLVPTAQIDFANQDNWAAKDEDIGGYVDKISEGRAKPIVLVNEPNDEKFMIVDGHHRGLAYEKLGQDAMAYVIHTVSVTGPWNAMHSSQKNEDGEPMLTSKQK